MSNKYYNQGKRAKELLNIYRNIYRENSFEHDQFKLGFKHGIYEPIDFNIELEDCSDVFDEYEAIDINPKSLM